MENCLKIQSVMKKINEIYIGGQLFPTACPKSCPGLRETFEQGGLCHICPIFNCTPNKKGFYLIEPHNYRQDWAKEFRKWFNNGWKGYPLLKI